MIDLEVSPGAQADAAAEEQLVDGHLTVPGGLEWDETPVERHTIANLRYAGGKEHNVRYVSEVDYDAALAREAALREELAEVKRHVKNADMVFDLLRIACDATGETTALVYSKLGDMLNAKAEAEALQQRLTVAEQRAEILEREFKKLRDVAHGSYQIASSYSGCIDGVEEDGGDDHEDPSCAIFHRLYYAMFDADAALKPAAEGQGS